MKEKTKQTMPTLREKARYIVEQVRQNKKSLGYALYVAEWYATSEEESIELRNMIERIY